MSVVLSLMQRDRLLKKFRCGLTTFVLFAEAVRRIYTHVSSLGHA